ncbi:MAG TPA: hypothetical protein PKK43_08750 [Spirochaetota bacterium]|nr:hypothetical protein [Spirochaetota bacterium]
MKYIAAVCVFAVMITSCGAGKDETVIRSTLESFFADYHGDFRKIEGKYLSADLRAKISAYMERENREAEKIARSDSPTDKPDMFDSDIFNASGDEFSSYEIQRVTVKNRRAEVRVRYVVKAVRKDDHDIFWTDTVIFVREGGWRIDDVFYGGLNGRPEATTSPIIPDLKQLLDSYIGKP